MNLNIKDNPLHRRRCYIYILNTSLLIVKSVAISVVVDIFALIATRIERFLFVAVYLRQQRHHASLAVADSAYLVSGTVWGRRRWHYPERTIDASSVSPAHTANNHSNDDRQNDTDEGDLERGAGKTLSSGTIDDRGTLSHRCADIQRCAQHLNYQFTTLLNVSVEIVESNHHWTLTNVGSLTSLWKTVCDISLPHLRSTNSYTVFKANLKTHLFSGASISGS